MQQKVFCYFCMFDGTACDEGDEADIVVILLSVAIPSFLDVVWIVFKVCAIR